MNSNSSGGKLEGFFTGKGFYIVLFLCAAVIGVSAWMMVAGERTMGEDIRKQNQLSLDNKRVETVILPPQSTQTLPAMAESETMLTPAENELQEESTEVLREEPVEEAAPAAATEPVYAWPVSGELTRGHSQEVLAYDPTMRDWRTHEGVDIAAALGSPVTAARAGSVARVLRDDLYGAIVVLDHGDGVQTVYASLQDAPAVSVGDWVELGDPIGAVGDTALCEIGQDTHLHFAVTVNGKTVDPLAYLPA